MHRPSCRNARLATLALAALAAAVARPASAAKPETKAHLDAAGKAEDDGAELEVLNAYDAFGAPMKGLTQDYGFSAVVRYKGKTILFDAGNDASVLEKNLFLLRVSPGKIDYAIGSHLHTAHVSGFDYLLRMNPKLKIYLPYDVTAGAPYQVPMAGPDGDTGESLPPEQRYYGGKQEKFNVRSSGRFWKANVEYVPANKEIAPGVTLILTPSSQTGTFNKAPPYEKEPFFVPLPELSASFSTSKGEVLLVGCAHSTLDTILQEARTFLKKDEKVVMGGFHLIPYKTDDIRELAKRLHDQYGVAKVAPAHCTGHAGFKVLREVYGDGYLFFGLGTTLRP